MKAGNFINVLKNPISTTKQLVFGIDRFNHASQDTINKYGKQHIFHIRIARTKLNKNLEKAIDALSLGEMSKLQKEKGYDNLYHLSLILTLSSSTNIIYEKNETVEVIPLAHSSSLKEDTEYMAINIKDNEMNLNKFIQNAQNIMGLNKYWSYKALQNNCQNFVKMSLQGSDLLSDKADKFIFQDMKDIKKSLEQSHSYFEPLINTITDAGQKTSLLMGKGVTLNDIKKEKILNYILHHSKIIHTYMKNGQFKYI